MTEYRNPIPTVDIIIELKDLGGRIVLVKRKNPPLGLALPGGFVDEGEPLWEAAVREAKEETGLDVTLLQQMHTYSDPARDPRRHTVSTVFIGEAEGTPQAGDDAAEVVVVSPEDARNLVFDHDRILKDYIQYRRTGTLPSPYS